MFLFIIYLTCLLSHVCLATIDQNNCRLQGERCVKQDDCCSNFNCSPIESKTNSFHIEYLRYSFDLEIHRCVPSIVNQRWKRQSDDLIIPPYYDPRNQLYPYGISKPALPFEKTPQIKPNIDGKNMGMKDISVILLIVFFH